MANFFGDIDNIVLSDYDKNYPAIFENEKQLLLKLLPDDITAIEHIGSTAIPGMKSKPVIDMQAALREFPLSSEKMAVLLHNGYVYRENDPDPNHQFFFKGLPRTHHLHLYPENLAKLKEHVLFRDCLLKNLGIAMAYEALKLKLAQEFYDDREKYTDSKTEFVNDVLKKCSIQNTYP